MTLALLLPGVTLTFAADALDGVLDEIDPTAPPPPPPPPGSTPGAGQIDVQLLRTAPPAYGDGVSSLAIRPLSPREISNMILAQSGSIPSEGSVSDMFWQWGQFVDHDIDLSLTDPADPAPITVPASDPVFDPSYDILFDRSVFDPSTGTDTSNPRQQMNHITAFEDASNVYGSDPVREDALRDPGGHGLLLTSAGNLLPYNDAGLPNAMPAGADPGDFFLAGDVRANEQIALTCMHTLWMREHNTVAARLEQRNKNLNLTDDQLYNTARLVVMAEQQSITYNEFLPLLLGDNALPPYTGYHPSVNPNISNVFATAAYRLGHTMLSDVIRRLDDHGNTIPQGDLALANAFFAPTVIDDQGGIEPILRGLSNQVMQKVDVKIVDGVRNFLFGPPSNPFQLDLGALNIQRGRDHGLPDYNSFRIAFGLNPVSSFGEITSDTAVQAALSDAYNGNVDTIDPWVGMIAEDHLPNELVGPTIHAVLVDQFTRQRDGNPDFYQNIFSDRAQRAIEKNTLKEVILRNTTIKRPEIPDNVFVVN